MDYENRIDTAEFIKQLDSQTDMTPEQRQEHINEHMREKELNEPRLWPANVDAFSLFQFLQTQWVRGGMDGTRTGLNHPSIESDMRMLKLAEPGTDKGAKLFMDIVHMERECLSFWAEKQKGTA